MAAVQLCFLMKLLKLLVTGGMGVELTETGIHTVSLV